MSFDVYLSIADQIIHISADKTTKPLLEKNYSKLCTEIAADSVIHLDYKTKIENELYTISSPTKEILETSQSSHFIYLFEKDLTIRLQQQRNDLFFMHGACLNLGDKTIIITGESGAGKSTTTWALTHHGFGYLSDELSPINLNTMEVYPYPHALCLKSLPPEPYTLPETTLKTDYTMHIPAEYLNGGIHDGTAELTHIFFVKYNKDQQEVLLQPVESTAAASMQIYKNTLNHLCHENAGLPAATQIASHCDCYSIEFSDVYLACLKMREVLKQN